MRGFVLLYRFDRWWRRTFTPAGGLMLAFLAEAAAFGVNTREVQVYQLFGLLFSLLVLAGLASLRRRHRIQVERRLPECVAAGSAFHYAIVVTNHGDAPCEALWVHDTLQADPACGQRKGSARAENIHVVDRLLGYRPWRARLRHCLGARLDAATLPPVAPGRSVTLTLPCLPLRRGVLHFAGTWAGRAEPLGLMRATSFFAHEGKVLVLPRCHPVRVPASAGVRRLQPRGESYASHVGDAEEFAGVRDYRPGDSTRHLHWKAWARSGTLVVKEYQEEYFVRQALVLDNFTRDGERFEAAVSAAASLVTAERPADSLLDLMFVEREAYTLTQGRGLSGKDELLRVLAVVEPNADDDFSILVHAVETRAARLSGVICILLDWDSPRLALVASLRTMGVPVHAWVIGDGEAPLDPGPLRDQPQRLRRLRPAHLAEDLAQA